MDHNVGAVEIFSLVPKFLKTGFLAPNLTFWTNSVWQENFSTIFRQPKIKVGNWFPTSFHTHLYSP